MEGQYRALKKLAPRYSWESRMLGVHLGHSSCQKKTREDPTLSLLDNPEALCKR